MKELIQTFIMVWLIAAVMISLIFAFLINSPFNVFSVFVSSTFLALFSVVYSLMIESKDLIKH
jgi:carbon starvation protein CstA